MWKALLVVGFPFAALAAPFTAEPEPDYELQKREAQLNRRNWPDYGFKGIYWEYADNATVCSPEKRDILLQTVKNIDAYYAQEPSNNDMSFNPAWQRFMGGRRVAVGKAQPQYNWFTEEGKPNYNKELHTTYANIQASLGAAGSFPKRGHKKGDHPNSPFLRRVTFLCQGPGERVPGHCAKTTQGPSAYTTAPDGDNSHGWTITFCDRFFDLNKESGNPYPHTFLDRVVADGYASDVRKFETYEHIMYHEFMHARIMGHPKHITDEKDTLPSVGGDLVTVYGATWTSEFAHVKYFTDESVNPRVATNADNYAWLATHVWLLKRWGANKDPFKYLDDPSRGPQLPDPSKAKNKKLRKRDGDAAAVDAGPWPRNCKWDSQAIIDQCEEIDMEYDEYVADLSTLSPECQQLGTTGPVAELNPAHPDCTCTDSSGKKLSLSTESCKGYVGYIVQCQDDGSDKCACSNGSDGTLIFDKPKDKTCDSLSVGLSA